MLDLWNIRRTSVLLDALLAFYRRTARFASAITFLGFAVVFGVAPITNGAATRLTGSLSTDWRLWQDSSYHRTQTYNAFRATLTIPTKGSSFIALRTNMRWRKDLDNSPSASSQLYVYETYLQFSELVRGTNLFVGRQFSSSNLGSALMDGARLQYRYKSKAQLDIFGGGQVQSGRPSTIGSIDSSGIFGARLSGRPYAATSIGAEWMLRRSGSQPSYQAVGFDVTHRRGVAQLFAQAVFNLQYARISTLKARLSVAPTKWYLSAEVISREPYVPANSVFSVVSFERYRFGRLGIRRQIIRSIAADASVNLSFTGSTKTWHTTLGISDGNCALGWYHQTGRGTTNNGFYGSASVDVSPRWSVFAYADLSQYRIQEMETVSSDSYSASLGLSWKFASQLSAQVEGQYLKNALRKNDYRLLLRLTKGFALKFNHSESSGVKP